MMWLVFKMSHQSDLKYLKILLCLLTLCFVGQAHPDGSDRSERGHHTHLDPQQMGRMGINSFYKLASSLSPITDKVEKHRYHLFYGRFVVPMAEAHLKSGAPLKFLEIGLGCNMEYPSGASVALWKQLFGDKVELWEADYDESCVRAAKSAGKLNGINVLTGDQLHN